MAWTLRRLRGPPPKWGDLWPYWVITLPHRIVFSRTTSSFDTRKARASGPKLRKHHTLFHFYGFLKYLETEAIKYLARKSAMDSKRQKDVYSVCSIWSMIRFQASSWIWNRNCTTELETNCTEMGKVATDRSSKRIPASYDILDMFAVAMLFYDIWYVPRCMLSVEMFQSAFWKIDWRSQ